MNRFIQRTWQPPQQPSVQFVQAASRLPAAHLLPGDRVAIEGERLTVASVRATDALAFLTFVHREHVLYMPRAARVRVIHIEQSRTLTIRL